jgi:holo-[acyl-carrier protein] synthase
MILGIGTDITNIQRIEHIYNKFPTLLVKKVLSTFERTIYAKFKTKDQKIKYLAKRFAAKEAVAKAIGIGIGVLGLRNVEVLNNEVGKPYVIISECVNINQYFSALNSPKVNIEISLSDEQNYTLAFVVLWV